MIKPATTQAVTKTPKSPAPPSSELPPTPRSTIQVVINQRDPRNDSSSVPGSLHDSADDESELSDVDDAADSAKARILFPNLGDATSGMDEEEREGSDRGIERGEDDLDAEEQGGRVDEEEEDAGNGDDDVDKEGEGEGKKHIIHRWRCNSIDTQLILTA